jgi:hypothetical protein
VKRRQGTAISRSCNTHGITIHMSSFDISLDYRPQLLPPARNIRLRLATRDNYFSAVKTQQYDWTRIGSEDKPCPETMGSRWLEAVHRNLVRDWGLIGRWYSVILGVGVVSGNMFFCAETKYHRKRCSPNTCRDYAVSIDEYINYIVSNKDWGWGLSHAWNVQLHAKSA